MKGWEERKIVELGLVRWAAELRKENWHGGMDLDQLLRSLVVFTEMVTESALSVVQSDHGNFLLFAQTPE